jgi:hypothetical protein
LATKPVSISFVPVRLLDGFFVPEKDAKESTVPLAHAPKALGFALKYCPTLLTTKVGDIIVLLRHERSRDEIFPVFLRGENSAEALTRRDAGALSRVVTAYRITAATPRYRMEVLKSVQETTA